MPTPADGNVDNQQLLLGLGGVPPTQRTQLGWSEETQRHQTRFSRAAFPETDMG